MPTTRASRCRRRCSCPSGIDGGARAADLGRVTRHHSCPSDPAREAALAQYRGRADRYDVELLAFEAIRRAAIDALALRLGDTVLASGCGTGLSFAQIEAGIGPRGHIVGIDLSPQMLAHAERRVAAAAWPNVRLACAAAEDAPLAGRADAALFVFTHDVLRQPAAVDHVLAHLRPGARVAAVGLKWAPAWAWPANLFVWSAAQYSTTSSEGLDEPWSHLAARLPRLAVRPLWLGAAYLASAEV